MKWHRGSVDDAIESYIGKQPVKSTTVLKVKGGWKTSLKNTGGRLFIVKEFPPVDDWNDEEKVQQAIKGLVRSSKIDGSMMGKMEKWQHEERRWLVIPLSTDMRCRKIAPEWKDLVGLASMDVSEDQDGKWTFPPNIGPLVGRPVFLAALTDTEPELITKIVDALEERLLGEYWGHRSDKRAHGAPVETLRRVCHELIHNDEQPHRFPEDEWTRPWKEGVISDCRAKFKSTLDDDASEIRTIYATKSHGDLWTDNIIFTVKGKNIEAYLIDPFHLSFRKNGDVECAKYPRGKYDLMGRLMNQHDGVPEPLPCPLYDVAHLTASVLVSLPFQGTQAESLQDDHEGERKKNVMLDSKTKELKKGLMNSFSDTERGNHVIHNVHCFLAGMFQLNKKMIDGVLGDAPKDEVWENASLLLVDRILFYAGFVLNDKLQDTEKDEFVGYIKSLLDMIVPTADAEA